jgi:hypothetical protein
MLLIVLILNVCSYQIVIHLIVLGREYAGGDGVQAV